MVEMPQDAKTLAQQLFSASLQVAKAASTPLEAYTLLAGEIAIRSYLYQNVSPTPPTSDEIKDTEDDERTEAGDEAPTNENAPPPMSQDTRMTYG